MCNHVKGYWIKKQYSPYEKFNVGTGYAISVLDTIIGFERVTGHRLNYNIGPRREGDVPSIYADTTKANNLLGWKAQFRLDEMIESSWNWEKGLT